MSPPLVVEASHDRVVVTLNRPERRNALGAQTINAFHAVCADLEANPRFLIVTGGPNGVFVGGADIAELVARTAEDALAGINLRLFDRIAALPLPTVAAIDGPAVGGGAELAYACDIRIITPRTFFSQPEPAIGIIAGAGAAWRLPALVGASVAKDMLLTGRRLSADDAVRFGLASDVVDPAQLLARAELTIDAMARSSTQALRFMKLAADAHPAAHPTVDLLAQAFLFESDEKRERMGAFLRRRTGSR